MNYTVIGDSVNLASRLEGLNKHYGTRILVSGATLGAAGEDFLARQVDSVTVKGKARPVGIHELVARRSEATPEQVECLARYGRAFALYGQRRWAEALERLAGLEADGPAGVLAARCRAYVADPPPMDWDGVFRHCEK
jgi:adenylate cyclase